MEIFSLVVINDNTFNSVFPDLQNSSNYEASPSKYLEEMQLSTDQRLQRLVKRMKNTKKRMTQNQIIEIIPNIVIFQNHQPNSSYKIPITIINVCKHSCGIKAIFEPSPYFTITCSSVVVPSKLAPGTNIEFVIQFFPHTLYDFTHYCTFVANDEEYNVPILAIGPRPLLNIPDEISLPNCLIDIEYTKTIVVTNTGKVPAIFRIFVNLPFKIHPEAGIIDPDSSTALQVSCISQDVGWYKDKFVLKFETGEQIYVKVEAYAQELNIYLKKKSIYLDDTYITLTSQHSVLLYNDSEHKAQFSWKMFLEPPIEEYVKEKFYILSEDDLNVKIEGISDFNHDDVIQERYRKDENFRFENQDLLFRDTDFSIIPLTGEIGPKTYTEINIIFKPGKVETFQREAYCDVTGLKKRLQLKLIGTGLGPSIKLNLAHLKVNQIYLHTTNGIEVVVINDGIISGELSFVQKEYVFGNEITCNVDKIYLEPTETYALVINFKALQEGYFYEELYFQIERSNKIIKFSIQGEVVCPILHVKEKEILLGIVSLGIFYSTNFTLYNSTSVDIPFEVKIMLPYKCAKEIDMNSENENLVDCKPDRGVVMNKSSLVLQIDVRMAKINIDAIAHVEIHMWNNESHKIQLNLRYTSALPTLKCSPPDIVIRFCFVEFPTRRTLKVKNTTQLPAVLKIKPVLDPDSEMTVNVSVTEFYISGCGRMELNVDLIIHQVGQQTANIIITYFGGYTQTLCNIFCVGQGPVITVYPESLDFGQIQMLEYVTKSFNIVNDSPIPAEIMIQHHDSPAVTISARCLDVPPTSKIDVDVTMFLIDFSKLTEKMFIEVANRSKIPYQVMGSGIGTCISTDPDIKKEYDFGPILTLSKVSKTITFTNRGVRLHKIFCLCINDPKALKTYNPADHITTFDLDPFKFVLKAKECINVELSTFSKKKGRIEEKFYFFAIIEKVEMKMLIIEATMKANFVEPTIIFSRKNMSFRLDVTYTDKVSCLQDKIDITNQSEIALTIQMKTSHPFYILSDNQCLETLEVFLENEEHIPIVLNFKPDYADKHSYAIHSELVFRYVGHPHIDTVILFAEVNYPNVKFIPNEIDFGCILSDSHERLSFELRNTSPLPVKYSWEWITDDCTFEHTPLLMKTSIPFDVNNSSTISSFESALCDESICNLSFLFINESPPIESAAEVKLQAKNSAEKKSITGKGKKNGATTRKTSVHLLPIENVFEHYCIEDVNIRPQIQIMEFMEPPLLRENLISVSENNIYNAYIMRQFLLPNILSFYQEENTIDVLMTLSETPKVLTDVEKMFKIIPFEGYLAPKESQKISIAFHSVKDANICAKAVCHVIGGPSEFLSIKGACSDINFSIDKVFIDFGRKSFHVACEKKITVTNTGYFTFNYSINTNDESYQQQSSHLFEIGSFIVTPRKGKLEPKSCVGLTVRYIPGIAGKFLESFQLEIGHLSPITITVKGYGVFPQIFLNLPRPSLLDVDRELCYAAIASITPDYLIYTEELRAWLTCEKVPFEVDIPKQELRKLKNDGWCVVAYNNKHPMIMDLDLAIERMLACKLSETQESTTFDSAGPQKPKYISNLILPAYNIDFGYVITETPTHRSIECISYGPIDTRVQILGLGRSQLSEAGFTLQLDYPNIVIGDTGLLHVIFNPMLDVYPERRNEVNYKFYIQVQYGARIPLNLSAIVTVPFIELSTTYLDFEEIICGQCKVKNFIIKNIGYVPCTYRIIIEKPKHKDRHASNLVFHVRQDRGELQPNQQVLVDVYFEPKTSKFYERTLRINVDNNREIFMVLLSGEGVEGYLTITPFLDFSPVVPYAKDITQMITVENPCDFPIEFCFTDVEDMYDEKVVNLLCHYYDMNELQIPLREAGGQLPHQLQNFYDTLYAELFLLKENERVPAETITSMKSRKKSASSKSISKYMAATGASSTDILQIPKEISQHSRAISQHSRVISQHSKELSQHSKEMSQHSKEISQHSKESTQHSKGTTQSLKEISQLSKVISEPSKVLTLAPIEITESDLSDFLKQKIASMSETSQLCLDDPIKIAISESKKGRTIEKEETKQRIYFIFYGGPFTDYAYHANKTAKMLNYPAFSIDDLIFETLIENKTVPALKINEAINETYTTLVGLDPDSLISIRENYRNDVDENCEIRKKVDFLLKNIEKSSAKTSKKSDRSSVTSKSSNPSSAPRTAVESDAFIYLIEGFLVDILQDKLLNNETGVVIETLNSKFIRQPTLVLIYLLTALKDVRFLQFVMIYNSESQYTKLVGSENEVKNAFKELTIQEKLESFDSITDEELLHLNEEDRHLYRNTYLAARRNVTKNIQDMLMERKIKLTAVKTVKSKLKTSKSMKSRMFFSKKDKSVRNLSKSSPKSSIKTDFQTTEKKIQFISNIKENILEELAFIIFEKECHEIKHILEYWDKISCNLTKDYVPIKKSKKEGKPPPKKKELRILKPMPSLASIPDNPDPIIPNPNVGIDSWFINNIYDSPFFLNNVPNMIQSNYEYQRALDCWQEANIEKLEVTTDLYSIIYKTVIPEKNLSDVFIIKPYIKKSICVTPELSETASHENISCVRFGESMSRSKTLSKEVKDSKRSIITDEMLLKPLILQPGECAMYTVQYFPKHENDDSHKYTILMRGWPTYYTIDCTAKCMIPRINMNPQVMFTNIIKERTEKNKYQRCVYIKSSKVFSFGNSLVQEDSNDKLSQEAEWFLHNTSSVPCEIAIHFINCEDVFKVNPEIMVIDPDDKQSIVLTANPQKYGLNTGLIAFAVKDNPKIETVALKCNGCNLKFEILNNVIIFERILLFKLEVHSCTLVNSSPFPVHWNLSGCDDLEGFNIGPKYGYLHPCSSIDITFEYCPMCVEMINKRDIEVKVYDEFNSGKPILIEDIVLLAESCDLQIDCPTHIDFGELKTQTVQTYNYTMLNEGTFSIAYEISELINPKLNKETIEVLEMFSFVNMEGVLHPNKDDEIVLTFKPLTDINIQKMPIFKCTFYDELNKKLLSTFLITASAKAYYSQFEVYPTSKIPFGPLLVGTQHSLDLTIKNTGKFPFEYQILCKHSLELLQENIENKKTEPKVTKKLSKSPSKQSSIKSKASTKTPKKGVPIPPAILNCGPFEIADCKNIINEGESITIKVSCNVTSVGTNENMIIVFVSESSPIDKLGKVIDLSMTGCVPFIDFEDGQKIFKEHYIVDKFENFVKPKDVSEHCVYVKSTETLVFNNVCVNTVVKKQIHLYNNSLVIAEVIASIEEPNNVFCVTSDMLEIQPYGTGYITITFSPSSLDTFTTNLEIQLFMPAELPTSTANFTVSGQGFIPEISILAPEHIHSKFSLHFIPLLLGKTVKKHVSYQNIGDLPCTTLIEITEDNDQAFSIEIPKEMIQCLSYFDPKDTECFKHTILMNLNCGQIATFYISYNPGKVGKNICIVKLHILNNPYEHKQVSVTAECYTEDIIIEDLPTATLNHKSSSSISKISFTSYEMDFGQCFLNQLYKKCFKVTNSSTEVYKFLFKQQNELKFRPNVGHLTPNTSKTVIVTFLSQEVLCHSNIIVECLVYKIAYTDEKYTLPWDDRQLVIFEDEDNIPSGINIDEYLSPEVMPNILEMNSEPTHEIIDDSFVIIPFIFSATTNYSAYSCNIEEINIVDTFLLEKNIYALCVYNIGEIPLEVVWNLIFTDNYNSNSTISNDSNTISLKTNGKRGKDLKKSFVNPFTIEPDYAIIPPNDSTEFIVTFAPTDVSEYKGQLKSKITNLDPNQKNIDISILAKSLMPYVHFDIESSDYFTSGRREINESEEIDSNIKVIEFECLGSGIMHKKSFDVINPMQEIIEYEWKVSMPNKVPPIPILTCDRPMGIIKQGKRTTAQFSVVASKLDTYEAAFDFCIVKYDIAIPFFFVAHVRNPDVQLSTNYIHMKPTVLGIPVFDSIVLKNYENVNLEYKFGKVSLYSEGKKQVIELEPMKGLLLRNSEAKIKLSCNPTEYGEFLFDVKCKVNFLNSFLTFGVTTTCYKVMPLVLYTYSDDKKQLLSPDFKNNIYLDSMIVNYQESITFSIRNTGKTGFYYNWTYNKEMIDNKFDLTISEKEGYTKSEGESISKLSVSSSRNVALKILRIDLKIKYGPTYKIFLNVSISSIHLKFSFLQHNFGPCVIQESDICHYNKILEVLNNDTKPLTLENNFENTNYLNVDFTSKNIPPKSKENISIKFYPRKCQKYYEHIPLVCKNQTFNVKISGEGFPVDIVLENVTDKFIDLGTPSVNTLVIKTVPILNRGSAFVDVLLDLSSRVPPPPITVHSIELTDKRPPSESIKSRQLTEKSVKKKSSKSIDKVTSSSKKIDKSIDKNFSIKSLKIINIEEECEILQKNAIKAAISIDPMHPIRVQPNQTAEFIIRFRSPERLPAFTENIFMQVFEKNMPLCVVQGSCLGPEYSLSYTDISFGTSFLNFDNEKILMLYNTGDLDASYKWLYEKTENFCIIPEKGHSTPGRPTSHIVKFHPTQLNKHYSCDMSCIIKGYKEPLELHLMGTGIEKPEYVEELIFSCPVRTTISKSIQIINEQSKDWKLYPSLAGEYFDCENVLMVPAKSCRYISIFYKPTSMSKDSDDHKGHIFFLLPTGQALLYNLFGTTEPPLAAHTFSYEVPAKENLVSVLTVKNWLSFTQQLKVETEELSCIQDNPKYLIKGLDYISIVANEEKEYKWQFYSYKEGLFEFKVMFINNEEEYVYFLITIKVTTPFAKEKISLSTPIRKPIYHDLILINPLPDEIIYYLKCTPPSLNFYTPITVAPHSQVTEKLEYDPKHPGEETVVLNAYCAELGSYLYEFNLTAEPCAPGPTVIFNVTLGESLILFASVKNMMKSKTEFITEFEEDCGFDIINSIPANSFQLVQFPITYFPFQLENVRRTLKLSSVHSGDYIFILEGNCTPPKTAGPLYIKPGYPAIINFYNPFLEATEFILQIEPSCFCVASGEELFQPRTMNMILVNIEFDETVEGSRKNVSGKLTITTKTQIEGAKWVYYLSGK